MAAYYINSVEDFLKDNPSKILGDLTSGGDDAGFYEQKHSQTDSWKEQIEILKNAFQEITTREPIAKKWGILLEYAIVRRAKRIDVIIINDGVFVLEFKVDSKKYDSAFEDQVIDYCLDLRDFHHESRGLNIYPVLVATKAEERNVESLDLEDGIYSIQYANRSNLSSVLLAHSTSENLVDYKKWDKSSYIPTPTIIEAAQTLYAGQDVREISHSQGGAHNLTKTSNAVINAIKQAKEKGEKIICFITGVPGAGKTLAGLNIAHHIDFQNEEGSLATFMSGNIPLIKVLRGALAIDAYRRLKEKGIKTTLKEERRKVAFIENIHRFIENYFIEKEEIPNNKIVIFDEAQRAWDAKQSKRKFKRDFSEPELLFEIMERHRDWAVIVALVGGGQEINTGEAGLPEWGRVLTEKHSDWKVYISKELKEGNHSTGNLTLFERTPSNLTIIESPDLHLNVSIRSYKAEKLSEWVALVLNNKPDMAKVILQTALKDYRLAITRDLGEAKKWLRKRCKGSRRMGLVASSGGRRLRPYGIEVKLELQQDIWFLNSKRDVRASNFLEIPATEFAIQGLELDWVGVCWDGDMRRGDDQWEFKNFNGTVWQQVKNQEDRMFILNTYRVLLTRARQGMIIWIPQGEQKDKTRDPKMYNEIFKYLKSCGVEEI